MQWLADTMRYESLEKSAHTSAWMCSETCMNAHMCAYICSKTCMSTCMCSQTRMCPCLCSQTCMCTQRCSKTCVCKKKNIYISYTTDITAITILQCAALLANGDYVCLQQISVFFVFKLIVYP